ncbi:hypothetical protein GGR53DRAFT_513002 [Hypoxylon sp. FL1150]|nr:hypothetical protein GGR53DRAFT_513002 [Hypoxylon sp. FL1150]
MAAPSSSQDQATASQDQTEAVDEFEGRLVVRYLNGRTALINCTEVGGYDTFFPKIDSIPLDPADPLSPVASVFGPSTDPFWRLWQDDGAHSSLAPEFPSANDQSLLAVPRPDNIHLDRLFYGERFQVQGGNIGVKSWQLPALTETLTFGASTNGGNPAAGSRYQEWVAFRDQAVKINRDEWLSCFKASHWFDLRLDLLSSLRNPTPGLGKRYLPYGDKTWFSMDNEAVAFNIDLALELASRVLRQLCADQNEWLDAILFAAFVPCGRDPAYRFDEEYQDEVYRLRSRPVGERATADELWSAIENLTGEHVYFGFTGPNVYGGNHGVTRPSELDYMDTVITLDTEGLRPLFEMDSTVAERCTSLLHLSSTYYNKEWISELGYSFENAIWGGALFKRPGPNYFRGRKSGYNSHLVLTDFPGLFVSRVVDTNVIERNGYDEAFEEDYDCFIIPTFWVTTLLCERFWTDVVASRGSAAFRPPRIISSRVLLSNWGHAFPTSAHFYKPPSFSVPELEGECKRFFERWEINNVRMWTKRSEWYDEEYASWQLLPWSDRTIRKLFNKFSHFHTTRNLFQCRALECQYYKMEEIIENLKESTPHIYAMEFIVKLLIPWYIPASAPPSEERQGLLWPSSSALEWFNSNATKDEVAIAVTDSDPPTVRYPVGYYTSRFGTQLKCLDFVHSMIKRVEYTQGGPISWLKAIDKCYTQMRADREANPDINSWASFDFTVPPYEQSWVRAVRYGGYLAYGDQAVYTNYALDWRDGTQGSSLFISPPNSPRPLGGGFPPPGGPPPGPSPPPDGSPPGDPPSASGPPSGGSVVATKMVSSGVKYPLTLQKRPYPRYFFISHVANHRRLDNAWIVEPDNNFGFDVFRITNLLKELGTTENDYREIVITGPQGPTLAHGDRRAEVIRARLSGIKPIGKLILMKRAEEVAECNGRNGQSACVSVGRQIYDITNFPFQLTDYRLGLPQSAGGPVPTAILKSQTRSSELLNRLDTYLCAYLEVPQPAQHMQYYTPRKLRWHDNPDLGIYIAVNNVVFDITTYIRFHPGGNRLLLQHTGRDATQAFHKYHDTDILKFYENMKVGYLVPEIEIKDMDRNHVAVHEWVYDISALVNENPSLYKTLRNCCAMDTTAALSGSDSVASALATLSILWKSLICAGLAKTDLPDFPSGELKNYDNHRTSRGAFVVVNGYVYNTTHLMRYPNLYERTLGPNWAGREITITGLGEWVATNFEARRIARLVEGPAWERPNVNIDPDEAYAARRAGPHDLT